MKQKHIRTAIYIIMAFFVGAVLSLFFMIYNLKIAEINTNGEKINNASVTITLLDNNFEYYME